MTSREDLLDQYIDALNTGSVDDFDVSDDPEVRALLQTAQQVKTEASIEWPEFDLPSEMSQTLAQRLNPAAARERTANEPIEKPEESRSVTSIGATRGFDEDKQSGWRWYMSQFAGMAAAAAVVALFALGLAYILGGWGGEIHAPGAFVDEGELPGTILYTEYDGEQTIARIDADGTNQQDLTARPSLRPDTPGIAWSPDGEWIAYFEPEEREAWSPAVIRLISADGVETRRVAMEPVHGAMRLDVGLDWSHDGNSLAFVHQDEEADQSRISTIHHEEGGVQTITPGTDDGVPSDRSPTWAPDQWALAFTRVEEGGRTGIYLIYSGMPEPVQLVTDDARAVQPEWSPDGESIAYVGGGDDPSLGNLHVVDVDSGRAENITNHDRTDYLPVWSSRDQIAFMSDFGDMEYDIFVVNPDGSDVRNITEDYDWHVYRPDWSDEGRYLTFTSVNEDQRWRINVYDIDEERLYTVLESENPLYFAQWRPEADRTDASQDLDMDDVDINLSEEEIEMIQRSVEQFLSEEETPAVQINDEVISAEQIAHQVEVARTTRIAYDGIPHADQLPEETRRFHEEMEALTQETGLENVVLVGLLASSAVQQWAEQEGLTATKEQIDEEVDRQRDLYEQLRAQVPENQPLPQDIIIDAVGEDRYWDEYLPRSLQESLTEQNVNQALLGEADFEYDGRPESVLMRDLQQAEFRADLIQSADIEVIDDEALGEADLDTAIEYITETYPAFLRDHRDRDSGPDSEVDPATEDDAVSQPVQNCPVAKCGATMLHDPPVQYAVRPGGCRTCGELTAARGV
jgi:Tol biopolymer transport system component